MSRIMILSALLGGLIGSQAPHKVGAAKPTVLASCQCERCECDVCDGLCANGSASFVSAASAVPPPVCINGQCGLARESAARGAAPVVSGGQGKSALPVASPSGTSTSDWQQRKYARRVHAWRPVARVLNRVRERRGCRRSR